MWDILIIGGGATGVGIALDAAARGYSVLLCEKNDFGSGTSSRSTKLAHGGVRYLQQGNISLVKHALKERGLMRRNAPHLVHDLEFIVPNYKWWEGSYYGLGMKIYDLMAGKLSFGKSLHLSAKEVTKKIPTIEAGNLLGGVLYHDGQFDDTRLLISIAQTAQEKGAVLCNYTQVDALDKDQNGKVNGAKITDLETGQTLSVTARCVINAAGPFCDQIIHMDEKNAPAMIAPSQGVHLVFDRKFLPGNAAIIVPKTSDGRVMFAIPWLGFALVGTTDTPIEKAPDEPRPLAEEIDFILETAGQYLRTAPQREDVLSLFAGVRALVKASHPSKKKATSKLSRDHTIHISGSNLLTIAGGKWTTYRHMAEDAVNHAITLTGLENRPCVTANLHLHGYKEDLKDLGELTEYGSDADAIIQLIEENPALGAYICNHPPVLGAQVVWAVRNEMARQVEDVLARRTRVLFLNARAAIDAAPQVAKIMAGELGHNSLWQKQQVESFTQLAQGYLL